MFAATLGPARGLNLLRAASDAPVPVDDQGRTDSAAVNQLRLRIDTRKWIASKFRPAMYGDKVDISTTIRGADQKPDAVMAQIVGLLEAHGMSITVAEQVDGPGSAG